MVLHIVALTSALVTTCVLMSDQVFGGRRTRGPVVAGKAPRSPSGHGQVDSMAFHEDVSSAIRILEGCA